MKNGRAVPEESIPKVSELCQSLTREGKTVQVEIHGDGGDGWLLQVVDEYGNLTGWIYSFRSEQAALEEVLKTIDEEGMDCLVGPPSPGWY